jgi:hypothetical protein
MSETSLAHWRSVASEWCHFGPPLRPCDEDIRYMAGLVTGHLRGKPESQALLCGVTPEIALMPWPSGTRMTAVERSSEMIDVVWPGDVPNRRRALQGDWLTLPLPDRAFDIVIGDGCFISMHYPEGYRALAGRIARLLSADGLLLMRFFVQAQQKESAEDVFSDLESGKIASFHVFKWRLVMALQPDPRQGVKLDDIYLAWRRSGIDERALAERMGWSADAVRTIDLYQGKPNHFSFPTREQLVQVLQEHFDLLSLFSPGYELGECCPILALAPRG